MAKRTNKAKTLAKENNYQDAAEVREYRKGLNRRENARKSKFKEKRSFKPDATEMINNVSWYTPNSRLLNDVASFPFGRITGLPILTNQLIGPNGTAALTEGIAVPGILSLQLMPTFGPVYSNLSTSPLNQSLQSLFSFVRHANSGAANYESNDLGLYILSVGEVISYFTFLVRLYGVSSNYSIMNRYTPEAIVTAMGVNFNDVQVNRSDLRAAINLLAYRLQTLVIPKGISLIDRRSFIYEGVYTDADNAKAQYYMFNPIGFYQYFEGSQTTNGGYLQFKPLVKSGPTTDATNLLTVQELIAYADDLLNPILGSTDFNEIIAGDILKAFGAGNLYSVPSISEDYQVVPVYNKEILTQIENAVVYDGSVSTMLRDEYIDYMPSLKQVTEINSSTLEPTIVLPLCSTIEDSSTTEGGWNNVVDKALHFDDYMLNFHDSNITPEMSMVASRLVSGDVAWVSNLVLNSPHNVNLFTVGNCGTEIVFNGAIYYFNQTISSGNITSPVLTVMSISRLEREVFSFGGTSAAPTVQPTTPTVFMAQTMLLLSKWAMVAKFDWAPRISAIIGFRTSNGLVFEPSDITWDLDNFTMLSKEQVQNLHNIAVYAEFNCTSMGAYSPK